MLPIQYVSVEEECKRNSELKMSDLQMLKDWMDKQPHLPNIEMLYLIMFLHSNYYNIEPTKRTIENFFTTRTHVPEIFSNRDPIAWKQLRKAFTVVAVVPLEQETKEGYIMTLGKFLDMNPSQFDCFESAKYLFMTCEVQNLTRGTSNGMVVILDSSGMSFGHLSRMNLMGLKKILYYVQEAAPVRLKAIHVLNAMPAAEMLLNMLKPFVKADLLNHIHFHSNLETLNEFLPTDALPNEMDGKAGPLEEIIAKHIKLLEDFREWFQYDEFNNRVNESLRVGKCQTAESLFGMEGSFKKLEID